MADLPNFFPQTSSLLPFLHCVHFVCPTILTRRRDEAPYGCFPLDSTLSGIAFMRVHIRKSSVASSNVEEQQRSRDWLAEQQIDGARLECVRDDRRGYENRSEHSQCSHKETDNGGHDSSGRAPAVRYATVGGRTAPSARSVGCLPVGRRRSSGPMAWPPISTGGGTR